MTRPSCGVPGCGRPHCARGYCRAHHARWLRHGHPQTDLPIEEKTTGGVGYWACHERVKAQRGPASAQRCADCGAEAVDWSYDGTDPDERTDPERGYRYSLDPARYRPRCRSCHRKATVARHRARATRSAARLDVERVARLYRDGATGRGIAQLFGTSHTAVYAALHASGVALRPRGGTRGHTTADDVSPADLDTTERTNQR
jgi:hypothetical protein